MKRWWFTPQFSRLAALGMGVLAFAAGALLVR
jgi:hypothetical protein